MDNKDIKDDTTNTLNNDNAEMSGNNDADIKDAASPFDNTDTQVASDTVPTAPDKEDVNQPTNGKNAKSKIPFFALEPKSPGCVRNDSLMIIGKKIGFIGLIVFLLASIIAGVLNTYNVFPNRLNILFVGIAAGFFGIQNIIERIAVNKCRCQDCINKKKRYETIAIVCMSVMIIIIAVFIAFTLTGSALF